MPMYLMCTSGSFQVHWSGAAMTVTPCLHLVYHTLRLRCPRCPFSAQCAGCRQPRSGRCPSPSAILAGMRAGSSGAAHAAAAAAAAARAACPVPCAPQQPQPRSSQHAAHRVQGQTCCWLMAAPRFEPPALGAAGQAGSIKLCGHTQGRMRMAGRLCMPA
jgi:hypothetical protein